MGDPGHHTQPTSARVLVVEDEPELQRLVTVALEGAGHRVCAFSRGEDAIFALSDVEPDVAIVDLGLPGLSGLETIRAARAASPSLPILVLTASSHREAVLDAVEAGASGYLVKGARMAELVRAVELARDGLSPLSPRVSGYLFDAVRGGRAPEAPAPEATASPLTAREREVLSLLIGGHTYSSVALALDIGVGTVQSYVKRIYRKLEVASKAEAVAAAYRLRLLDSA